MRGRGAAPDTPVVNFSGQLMNGPDASAAVVGDCPGVAPDVCFLGNSRVYWRLLTRGAALLMVTLGIYRFWLTTDVRRFLWSNTEICGETLEYSGTAAELLIGFLIAIVILLPVYAAFFFAALDLGLIGKLSGAVGFFVLALLGQYGAYRARRYRLTRTVYRGIRFHQDGSAWRYACIAMLWWGFIIVSLGLAYPWAQASLERFKMRHTFFGNLPARFDGSAWRLFWRGLPMWLLVVGPIAASIVVVIDSIDPAALANAATQGGDDILARVEEVNPGFYAAIVFAMLAVLFSVLAAAFLYPAFQAMTLRWWTSGLRFGDVAVTSRLRTGQVYKVYGHFLWVSVVFAIAIAMLGWAGFAALAVLTAANSLLSEIMTTAALLVGYVITMLGYSTIYQATVKLGLWRLGAESLAMSGYATLEKVKAAGRASSAIGEGLADALHTGGI